MVEKLLSYLDKKEFGQILEIGCGTGLLTEYAAQNIKFDSYTAIDIVPDCENYIRKLDERIKFVCADAEKVSGKQKYDLILSNAAFQWFEKPDNIIKNLILKLNANGILLFTTFGTNNCKEIYEVTGKTLDYYSPNKIKELTKDCSAIINEETLVLKFKTPLDVLKHLKLTGVNAIESTGWTKSNLIEFEEKYLDICTNYPQLTYNPLYIRIVKNR